MTLSSASSNLLYSVALQGLVKFDARLVNVKESSAAPEISADADQASEDVQHHEGSSVPPSHTGQSQHQPPARQKIHDTDKRPKKKAKKAQDTPHASWDVDRSSHVGDDTLTIQKSCYQHVPEMSLAAFLQTAICSG